MGRHPGLDRRELRLTAGGQPDAARPWPAVWTTGSFSVVGDDRYGWTAGAGDVKSPGRSGFGLAEGRLGVCSTAVDTTK